MRGSIDRTGVCNLQWDLQMEKLYSPDGLTHCLPCERCGDPQWVQLNAVSTICDRCALALTDAETCSTEELEAAADLIDGNVKPSGDIR